MQLKVVLVSTLYTSWKSQFLNLNGTNVPITTCKGYQKLITSKTTIEIESTPSMQFVRNNMERNT